MFMKDLNFLELVTDTSNLEGGCQVIVPTPMPRPTPTPTPCSNNMPQWFKCMVGNGGMLGMSGMNFMM